MVKNKHPADRAERRKIDENKKSKRKGSNEVSARPSRTISSDDQTK